MSALTPDQINVVGLSITTSAISGGPPTSPSDGDIWIATNVDANGTRWQFQYNAGSASAYKWEFIGGAPAISEVTADEGTISTTYADLTTVGPQFTLPRGGDYWTVFNAHVYEGSIATVWVAMKRGVNTTSDNDSSQIDITTTSKLTVMSRQLRVNGMAASDVLKLQYRVNGGTGQFRWRSLSITPIRVS